MTSVVLPTWNEADSVGKVIDEIRQSLGTDTEIIVVDYNSRDGTRSIAMSMGATVITEERKGVGWAVRTGFSNVTPESNYVVLMDADFTYPSTTLPYVVGLMESLDLDVVIGHRRYKDLFSMSPSHRIGNRLLSLWASLLYGFYVRDVCTGFWVIRQNVLRRFNLTSTDFALVADLFANSVKTGCRIEQLPIRYRPRVRGGTAKLKMFDGVRLAWFLLKRRFA